MISQGSTGIRLYWWALLIALAALPTIEGYSQEEAIPKDAFIEKTTFTVEEITVLKEPLVIEGDAAPGTVECKGFKDQIDLLLKMTLNQTWPQRLALYTRESAKQLEVTGAKEAFEKREIKSLEDARKIQTVILGFIRLKSVDGESIAIERFDIIKAERSKEELAAIVKNAPPLVLFIDILKKEDGVWKFDETPRSAFINQAIRGAKLDSLALDLAKYRPSN